MNFRFSVHDSTLPLLESSFEGSKPNGRNLVLGFGSREPGPPERNAQADAQKKLGKIPELRRPKLNSSCIILNAMIDETLAPTPTTLLVFIDETGNEDYSDQKNPTFGRGGCAVMGRDYRMLIKKPWRKLKRERMGGANKPFHATEFEQSRPTKAQITGINRFLKQPFWRFAAMSDSRTELPEGIDGHRAISLVTINFIRRLVATHENVTDVALVFEASGRGDRLVERDFDLANMNLVNGAGKLL